MKTIVYTAIYGGYDDIKSQPVPVEIFTEATHPRSEDHPRMQAKYFKCMPHEVLDCDISIWIDGSGQILGADFAERCVEYLGDADIMAFKHPERDCIYEEAKLSSGMLKYQGQDIMGQVSSYGYPEHGGLWACGMIVRRHNAKTKKFNKLWWRENQKWTYQDQLSFPICILESGVNLKTLGLNLWNNDLISFLNPHVSTK